MMVNSFIMLHRFIEHFVLFSKKMSRKMSVDKTSRFPTPKMLTVHRIAKIVWNSLISTAHMLILERNRI